MTKEEYREILENDDGNGDTLNMIQDEVRALIMILINKGIVSLEDYKEFLKVSRSQRIYAQVEKVTDTELKSMDFMRNLLGLGKI